MNLSKLQKYSKLGEIKRFYCYEEIETEIHIKRTWSDLGDL
jgi:hypothetical protein